MSKKKPETLVEQVGRRIRQIRTDRGLTQALVAEAAGCDPQTIQRAESGKFGLSLNRLESVARGLGVPIVELFNNVESEVPPSPWSAEDGRLVAVWSKMPESRKEMALKVLSDIAEG